ncbi:hypothetical protein F5B21DRAFT_489324 [Xylaria acuta]|nr:hypothetical protein F5B21DRAFT_489324 [Xylaria acuta]
MSKGSKLNSTLTSPASSGPPAWLFSNNSTSSPSTQLAAAVTPDTMAKKDKKAQKAQKAQKPAKPAKQQSDAVAKPSTASTSTTQKPPAQLMDLVESFLSEHGFNDAHREFQKHRATKAWKGHSAGKAGAKEHHSLVSVFQTWETFASKDGTPNAMAQVTSVSSKSDQSSSSSSDSSDSDSSSSDESSDDDDVAMADAPAAESSSESSSSDSSSESESDSDEENATASKRSTAKTTPTTKSLKRKAASDTDSSSSDSGSDEEMSGSNSKGDKKKPQAKKIKTEDSSDESSDESDSSSDDSSDDEAAKSKKAKKIESDSDSSSESDSDSSSSSESESESEDEVETAAKVPLPDSDSDSSSESESESKEKKPTIKTEGKAANGAASDSSATLQKASPEFAPLPPNPTTFKANNRGNGSNPKKTENQPFSRISKDVVVDPRLSSNAYVSHGYGEQAHRDLIVTKGKGFTKEKNKKKRGSYKGGPLDVHTSRSFKFED